MLQSRLQGLVSNNTVNECIDLEHDSDESDLLSAKAKLYELMERMKRMTSEKLTSSLTMQELKVKMIFVSYK